MHSTYPLSVLRTAQPPCLSSGDEMTGPSSVKCSFDFGDGLPASDFNETWQMPWGEQLDVINIYKELKVELQEKTSPERFLNIIFKV